MKIRGFRVDLDEIRNFILGTHAVEDVVVTTRDIGDENEIAVFFVAKDISEKELKIILSDRLPPYMVPKYVREVEKIPLNPNGKVDWKALPDIQSDISLGESTYSNQTESTIIRVFHETLRIDEITRDDDFVSLGGFSIICCLVYGT